MSLSPEERQVLRKTVREFLGKYPEASYDVLAVRLEKAGAMEVTKVIGSPSDCVA